MGEDEHRAVEAVGQSCCYDTHYPLVPLWAVEDDESLLLELWVTLDEGNGLTCDLLIELLTLAIVFVEYLALCLRCSRILGNEELDRLSAVCHTPCGIDTWSELVVDARHVDATRLDLP